MTKSKSNSKKNKFNNVKKERFVSFIFEKPQLIDWLIAVGICVIAYIVLKICYPFPATMSDSGGYVQAAQLNSFNFYRPFGYSLLLQKIYSISSSIHAIFVIQMLMYLISTVIFALTIKYFFRPAKQWIWYVMFVLFTFSPLAFFMANSIMSDILFSVMIYFMLAAFVFTIMKKSWLAFALFSITLFCTLHIRYSAMIFPIVLIPFLLTIKSPIRWVSPIIGVFVLLIFYNQMKSNMRITTKLDQFSTGFDGWQLINNALHVVPYIDLKPEDIKNPDVKDIHNFMLQYHDSIIDRTDNGSKVTASFLWINDLPLKQYLFKIMNERNLPYAKTWIMLGTYNYRDYGMYIITRHPMKFLRYYYFPNMKSMFYPTHTGIMREYIDIDKSFVETFEWYNISDKKDISCKNDFYGKFLTQAISISQIFVWIGIAAIACLSIIKRKKINFTRDERIVFWGIFTFGVIYYASTIFASPIELRYWLPMASVQFSFCYILLNKLADVLLPKKIKKEEI